MTYWAAFIFHNAAVRSTTARTADRANVGEERQNRHPFAWKLTASESMEDMFRY
jgi:hypothetical protein